MLHIGDSEWECTGSLGWVYDCTATQLGWSSADKVGATKAKRKIHETVNLSGLDYIYVNMNR